MKLFSELLGIYLALVFLCCPWRGSTDIIDGNIRNNSYRREANSTEDCIYATSNLNDLSQNQFLQLLISECRYDKLSKPKTTSNSPLTVNIGMDIRHTELLDQQQFKMDTLIQYRYTDERLKFDKISPGRDVLLGRYTLKHSIWIPHVVIAPDEDFKLKGLGGTDVFISISPEGEVSYAYRTSISLYCWMDFRKFPFDKQMCHINFQSWLYNASEVLLLWEEEDPVKMTVQMHLTGFVLEGFWTSSLLIAAPTAIKTCGGNYSSLEFKFKVSRETGHYLIDYFIPSIMLVCTSWVTFWLHPDAGPPRTTLGTSTMLSLITLSSGQTKTLPKVSYIKISEIWFLVCALFIFASLLEYAFVNLINRRRKDVQLKKVNSKYILKCTVTPGLSRNEFRKSNSSIHFVAPCSNTSLNSLAEYPDLEDSGIGDRQDSITGSEIVEEPESKPWTNMTPKEVANWIDTRCRVAFPIAFLIFNICFWTWVLSVTIE